MLKPGSESRKNRDPLSRERVLRSAIEIADTSGIGALTIRALAQRLGVKPMSIYYYVPNKSAILDGIVDLVFSEIELPAIDGDWRSELVRRANSARQVLSRHHWAIGLMESRKSPGPATLRHHDAVLGTLRRAGFSIAMTAHAYALLDSYVYGFALQEAAMPFQGADTAADVTEPIMERFRTDQYPHLAEMATEHILQPGYDFGTEFEFGLAVILDALTRSLPETLRASNHIDQVGVDGDGGRGTFAPGGDDLGRARVADIAGSPDTGDRGLTVRSGATDY